MSPYPKAVQDGWHPVIALKHLGKKPVARSLMGRPVVIFRTKDGVSVLVDRCPHRNMALSRGKVRNGEIECPYHGWRFAGDGRCTLTPGVDTAARHGAEALPVVVRAGLVFTTLAAKTNTAPVIPEPLEAEGFDCFLWPVKSSPARVLDAVENLLDPGHPHFLHSGIVRTGKRNTSEVTIKVERDHAEAIYLENNRPGALMPRALEGKRHRSVGRFFLPSTGQVAFESETGPKLVITVFFSPENDTHVRPYAHFATPKGRGPAWLKELLLRAFDTPILSQDRAALRHQAENITRFGGQTKYALGPLDVLFPAVQALMSGEAPTPSEHKVLLQL